VPAMVDAALRRATARGIANVRGAVLDLEAIDEPDASFDVVLCREGMMFAIDPAQAAREMRRVLRPDGRLAVAVWAAVAHNPWLGIVLDSLRTTIGVELPPPGMPGPFALGDERRLRQLFAGAGCVDITIERIAAPLRAASFDAWWERNLTVAGPVVKVLNGLDDGTRTRVRDAVRVGIASYVHPDGLELPGLSLLLTARR
jgi:SAM-dependent methyltransferase